MLKTVAKMLSWCELPLWISIDVGLSLNFMLTPNGRKQHAYIVG